MVRVSFQILDPPQNTLGVSAGRPESILVFSLLDTGLHKMLSALLRPIVKGFLNGTCVVPDFGPSENYSRGVRRAARADCMLVFFSLLDTRLPTLLPGFLRPQFLPF